MTEMDFKISVAMTTYNGEAFVEEQIESILRQTRLPDELVVSDDGSTDRTIDLIKKATTDCSFPVRIFRNARNVGPTRNFENAIREATGDIIFPCDQDDYWLPERVDVTASVFGKSRDVVLTYCDAELADGELRPSGSTLFSSRPRLRIANEVTGAEALVGAAFVQGMTIAFHRNFKPFALPFSDQCSWDRWLSFLARAVGEVRAIDRPLVYYRRHGKNTAGALESEKGLKGRWSTASDREVYAYRAGRWEAVHVRLQEIKASGLPLPSANRLDEFLDASGGCLRFARLRENMKGRPRIARVFGALSSLTRGDYHRYAEGTKSCILDVAAR
jgi:glycosyltransferase involved in cell wall biosynthesis